MTNNNIKPPIRLFTQQKIAWDYLHDDTHTEILYWWWAWWGKTMLGCLWLASQIASKPWSTWGMWRAELKKIKLSTFLTFKKVLKDVGFDDDSYKFDDQKGVMTFINGSMVMLVDLAENPSDSEYNRLGSTERTGFFADEVQEITWKAKNIVTSRLRNLTWETLFYSKDKKEAEKWIKDNNKWILHYNKWLDEYEVVLWKQEKPKMFMSCNPGLNFIYTDFYKAQKNNTILSHRTFVQSLPTQNPFLPESYIESLKLLDKVSRERLLYGNFEYQDEPWLLFDIDVINNVFSNTKQTTWEYFLTIDAARLGKDKTEIGIWDWLHLKSIRTIDKWDYIMQSDVINQIIKEYNIELDNVIVDESGVGWWLVDILRCRWFISNQSPMHPYSSKLLHYKKRNYQNLKTQAFFYLKQYFEENRLSINLDWKQREQLTEELMFIKQTELDNDSKIKLEPKKELKERLGRSPDLADMLSFRMWWVIRDYQQWKIEETTQPKTQQQKDEEELLAFLMDEPEKEDMPLDLSIY